MSCQETDGRGEGEGRKGECEVDGRHCGIRLPGQGRREGLKMPLKDQARGIGRICGLPGKLFNFYINWGC